MQEERNGVEKAPAWMIISGQMESDPVALSGFAFWRTASNSAAVKSSEIFSGVAVFVLQQSDTFFDTSRVDSQSAPLHFWFLRSFAATALDEMG